MNIKINKLQLKTTQIIQGDFEFHDLNLLFFFQVNCPGCFVHGFPMANRIFEKFHDKELQVLGLSTAFEDFELNTPENTFKAIINKTPVGETRRILEEQGNSVIPFHVEFPIAFDKTDKTENLFQEADVEMVCNLSNEQFMELPKVDQEIHRGKVREYLYNDAVGSYTFKMNLLRGTPSWLLFTDELDVLYQHFGHIEFDELSWFVERGYQYLEKVKKK